MSRVDLRAGASTHVGLVRAANEDAHLVAPPVFVVADGMGGHDHGEVASAFVVEEFARLAATEYDAATVHEVVVAAMEAVHDRIEAYDALHHAAGETLFSAGTTAVAALLVADAPEPHWLIANLGDSRGYRFRLGELTQVTVDHSLVQELVDAGTIAADDAAGHPDRHIVTRALGGSERHGPDLFQVPVEVSTRILLCSDGVSGMLTHEAIARILDEREDPSAAATEVVAAAVAAGGRDNATAVVVDVMGLDRERPRDTDVRQPSTTQETRAHS